MLKKGKKVSVYKIKEILSEERTHVCCLTEDPFFHSTVLLKVYSVGFLEDKQQRKHFGGLLEKLFLLEHPSIAPVLDSGFEGESFYYTTSYNHQTSLLERAAEGLSSEEILKIVRDLGSALEYAFDQDLVHGSLSLADIYFGDDAQAVIAGFGVEHNFNHFMENQDLEWLEEEALEDLGRLQLQLLRPSSVDNQGRELELLAGIENEKLKRVSERFFAENEDCYRSFSELLDALDSLLEQPPVETRPMVQQKALQGCSDTGISKQQREQVLPHVRQLISERNHYKGLLDEALLGQNKTECLLKQTRLELDQVTHLQLEAPQNHLPENRKKVAVWALGGFILGIIMSGSYGYTLQQKSFQQADEEKVVEKEISVVLEKPAEEKGSTGVAELKITTEVASVMGEAAVNESVSAVEESVEIQQSPLRSEETDKLIAVVAEQPQQWWPVGQEFSVAARISKVDESIETQPSDRPTSKGLTKVERDEIYHDLLRWLDSWSEQNPDIYFSHYSDQYRPELREGREEWLQTRKSRILRPDWITVKIENISMRQLADNRVQVKFQQNYRSNLYQDQIWKSLNLANEGDGWLILTERSLGKVDLVANR